MPCMCGAFDCNSCGPAQGNTKCYHCGAFVSDGGCADPEVCRNAEQAYDRDEYERNLREDQHFYPQWECRCNHMIGKHDPTGCQECQDCKAFWKKPNTLF